MDEIDNKYIGIIIQNQDKKILFYEDSYYIKVRVNKDDDIKKVIASKVKIAVDMYKFEMVKTFVYTPYSKLVDLNVISDEKMTMYLVEVYICYNEYDFVKADDLLDLISNHSEREFFKENFVDYVIYKENSQSFIFNNILILINLLVYLKFSIEFSSIVLLTILFLVICLHFIVGKCIAPKFIRYLKKHEVSINTIIKLNYLSSLLLIFVIIKTYLL